MTVLHPVTFFFFFLFSFFGTGSSLRSPGWPGTRGHLSTSASRVLGATPRGRSCGLRDPPAAPRPLAALGPGSRSGPELAVLSRLGGGPAMASLFSGRVLIRNNSKQDLLETEAERGRRLENRLVLLFFGALGCARCRAFAPALRDFFVRLTDEFHVVRAAQLALVYVSQDATAEQQALFLRDMPERWLFLPFEDDLRRDLGRRFSVQRLPAVVVLKPDGDVLTRDATDEIQSLGPACFANWQEAAEVLDRSFLPPEDLDEPPPRSLTEPLRRCKYRVDAAPERGRGPQGGAGEVGGAAELF
ncbi:LOW QUALITY PROTEIN: nucleoredoxin-like protein 1 [Erethizon dorsatum]